jgi:hypothetical protein
LPSLADKIAFAEAHVTNKEGIPFSLAGRDWVRDQFWLPCDGFKLWRAADRTVCDTCLDHVGEIIEHPADNPTCECECGGLSAEPIIVTVLNLQRQDGKTFSSMAYALATLFKSRNKSIGLLCASEDQAEALLRENYLDVINRNPALRKRCDQYRMRLEVPKQRTRLEALSTSHKSVTGRSRTHLLIDEARDIEARVVTALLPAVFAMHGIECPRGHVQLSAEQAINAPPKCSACGERLTPWYGRIVITSSSGITDDSEKDWLLELIEDQEANPHPNFHVFRSERALNPRKSTKIVGALEDVFGRLESTRHYVAAEMGNQWTRKGDDVVTPADVKRICDPTLQPETHCSAPCVAFFDTSSTVEKTCLVVLAQDTQLCSDVTNSPWEFLYAPRIDFWWPKDFPSGAIEVGVVLEHLRLVMPRFTNLQALHVDTSGSSWASQLVRTIKQGGGTFAAKVKPWKGGIDESIAGWDSLERRIRQRTIRLPDLKEMHEEFRGLRRKTHRGRNQVVDRDRRKMHKDITESLALLCWVLDDLQIRRTTMANICERQKSVAAVTKRLKSGNAARTFGGNWY